MATLPSGRSGAAAAGTSSTLGGAVVESCEASEACSNAWSCGRGTCVGFSCWASCRSSCVSLGTVGIFATTMGGSTSSSKFKREKAPTRPEFREMPCGDPRPVDADAGPRGGGACIAGGDVGAVMTGGEAGGGGGTLAPASNEPMAMLCGIVESGPLAAACCPVMAEAARDTAWPWGTNSGASARSLVGDGSEGTAGVAEGGSDGTASSAVLSSANSTKTRRAPVGVFAPAPPAEQCCVTLLPRKWNVAT